MRYKEFMRISCDDSQHKKNDDSFISKQYTDSDNDGEN